MMDVNIVGGGVMGLSIAYELANHGFSVSIYDRRELGKEASWAGAGMLPPADIKAAKTPRLQLRAASKMMWSDWSSCLKEESGIDNGFMNCGGFHVTFDDEMVEWRETVSEWRHSGAQVEEIEPGSLQDTAPFLSSQVQAAFYLPEMSQVRNPRHLKALLMACANKGVQLNPGTPVIGFETDGSKVTGIRTTTGIQRAGRTVIAGGAWSPEVLHGLGIDCKVDPVQGQIVLLSMDRLPFRQIIECGSRYLVPRSDGKILIGSTESDVGFNKENTVEGVGGLIQFAESIVPRLKSATFERAWAGLRPKSIDGLPYLGRVGEYENLLIAAGHYRDGLQLSPITARIIRQLICDESPDLPLEPFACSRGISA
ncbi:MAG: glycine oxidase ThiO [Planctomycetes bacterium]|nr:glycine oxidase ThiO [Planctomycetota bacterium]MCH9724632.1 glycine oxidase ThiO [Planctomycetota bacterium]MCH9777921.1 glycine oxidase ThiO [Planctomycetota bacterium]MCH9791327.1 glycine oxidase ThiO [Planctomycetota bacterium]MDF1742566.1 glycine oxidase ThiO [Gimesia sp.]